VLTYYYVKVPRLPPAVQHQTGSVEVVKYLAREGDHLVAGTPLVQVENWWAVMEFDAVGPGLLSKTFFGRGTLVKVADPFAIVICDPEDGPHSEESCTIRVIEHLREKPGYPKDVYQSVGANAGRRLR
jgi:pyruvate/2-oxoglutarate dehydrogenase complex dihydrolipoamide acyltransferase (E2) component